MAKHLPVSPFGLSRREMLRRSGMGFGSLALGALFNNVAQGSVSGPMAPRQPHFPAKAKRVIHLFMNGGPSQVDTFDPKPMLAKYVGKELPLHMQTERRTGAGFPSPFKFTNYGKSGTPVSEIFPEVGKCVDDICVIRSMMNEIPNHEPSLMMMNCGDVRQLRPSFGSWLTYGLGSENQNLPGFVVLCPNGMPTEGAKNWRSAFLPGSFQGTRIDTAQTDVDKLIENIHNPTASLDEQQKQLSLLNKLNARFAQQRQEDSVMETRVQSFELAFRMQDEVPELLDMRSEPESMLKLYGVGAGLPTDRFGRQCIMARRLAEAGVRFIEITAPVGWDHHFMLKDELTKSCAATDQPVAA
ncbi:MAG: hypothetical protein QOJ99_4868, partial [Bryobacterales bacterium]|nr:hypothetical protein [Bryobacterales bacterium]